MNDYNLVFLLVTLTIVFMIGIHAIDIGASLEIANAALGQNKFGAQSLGAVFQPYQIYHIGLLVSITAFMAVVFIAVIEKLNRGRWKN